MSGAQGKAAEIAGAASIIAEVDDSRITTRYTCLLYTSVP